VSADRLAPAVTRDASAREHILARLVEVCPFSIIVVESSGTIVLANGETARMFGYDLGELIGQPVDILVPARLRASTCLAPWPIRYRTPNSLRP